MLIIRRLRTLHQSLTRLLDELNPNIIAAVDTSTLPQLSERYMTMNPEAMGENMIPLGLLHRAYCDKHTLCPAHHTLFGGNGRVGFRAQVTHS